MSSRPRNHESPDPPRSSPTSSKPPHSLVRRWWLTGLALSCLAAGAVWLAPAIIIACGLQDRILAVLLDNFEGSLSVGSASLGWMSPVEVHDLRVSDRAGQALATARTIRSRKTLLSLLVDSGHPGTLIVEDPSFEIVVREDGSNWEDALSGYLSQPSGEPALQQIDLQFHNATLAASDQASGQRIEFEACEASISLSLYDQPRVQAELTGRVAGDLPPQGQLSAVLTIAPPSGEPSGSAGHATLQLRSIELKPLAAIARRWFGPWQAEGRLSGDVSADWHSESTSFQIAWRQLEAAPLLLRHATWANDEAIRTDRVSTQAIARYDGSQVHLSEFELICREAFLQGEATLDVQQLSACSTWPERLGQLLEQPPQVACRGDLPALARMFPSALKIRPGVDIRSGTISASLAGKPNGESGLRAELLVDDVTAQEGTRTLALQAPIRILCSCTPSAAGLVVDELLFQSTPMSLTGSGNASQGTANLRGDLGQLFQQTSQFIDWQGTRVQGQVTGDLRWRLDAGGCEVQADLLAENLQLVLQERSDSAPGFRIDEPRVAFQSRGVWDASTRSIRFDTLQVSSPTAAVQAAGALRLDGVTPDGSRGPQVTGGTVPAFDDRPQITLQGTTEYDLQALVQRFRPFIGPEIQLSGTRRGSFRLQGPLPLTGRHDLPDQTEPASTARSERQKHPASELEGMVQLGWQQAVVYGLHIGPGDLRVELTDGIVGIPPVQVPVSDGRFLASSTLDLNSAPLSLLVTAGPILDNVRLSPEMCRTWMQYLAPLLADATRVEGRLSLALSQAARVPFRDPASSRVEGYLEIHSAQVSPGPQSVELIRVAQQVRALVTGQPPLASRNDTAVWFEMPEQPVPFTVRDRRVFHERLSIHIGDVVVQTRGSVGFDESLDLVAEIPVRREWFRDRPRLAAAFTGTTLRIPIRGSLDQPRLDTSSLKDLGRDTLENAAGRILEQEIGRGLQRLFGPAR